jgi:alpha-L-fucosidase
MTQTARYLGGLSRRGLLRISAVAGAAAVAAPALSLATATPAHADLFNPRQDWLRDSLAGVFLHWGLRTAPVYTDVAAFEQDAASWSAAYWVGEAQKLHASYLVLASFHSKLGYLRAWPSAIPGSPTSQRDFLGELVTAAKAKGLHVILYMTDDPQWHAETGFDYFDVAAYQQYKNDPTVDITTRDGFGQFSYDNFVEVMQRYPDLSGFWIDNDNNYWLNHGLYELIRATRPNYLLSNNNEDTPIMDTVSNEQKTGMTPAYDYPQGIWTPAPRLTEADFKLAGNWWYDGKDHTIDYGVNLGRLITCAGASMKALIAEGAQVNGKFPPNYEAFNNFVKGYLDPIAESLHHTDGGGYLYGGLQPGASTTAGTAARRSASATRTCTTCT